MSYSKTILLGNLGADPRFKQFDNGGCRVDFTVATEDGYKDPDGNWVKTTDWHLCYCSGKRAETLAKYLKKGSQVHIEGRNKTRKYKDADGVEKYVTEVKVLDFSFTSKTTVEPQQVQQQQQQEGGGFPSEDEPDDLPF